MCKNKATFKIQFTANVTLTFTHTLVLICFIALSERTQPHVQSATNLNFPDISSPVNGQIYGQARSSMLPSFLWSPGLYSGFGVKLKSRTSYNKKQIHTIWNGKLKLHKPSSFWYVLQYQARYPCLINLRLRPLCCTNGPVHKLQ